MAVLNIITQREGKFTPIMIAELLGVSKPMITAHIRVLLKKGYISKELSENDKRSFYILPTDKAVALADQFNAKQTGYLKTIETALGKSEFAQLVDLLGKTVQTLENKTTFKEKYMYTEKLEFYPKHPSDLKTAKIETRPMPILSQNEPFAVKALFEEFLENNDDFFAHYVDKRFCVTGVAKKVGPDIHNKPSIELSDVVSGKTYALVIFPTDAHYSRVHVGDTVTVCANYLVMSNLFGTVMKYSELVSVKNENT